MAGFESAPPRRPSDGDPSPEEVTVAYHERTKHHYHRYAASAGHLYWATQPNPFRRYGDTLAFRARVKSAGFVVLLEGVMVFAQTQWLALAALAYLAAINGLATGCNLALDRKRQTR